MFKVDGTIRSWPSRSLGCESARLHGLANPTLHPRTPRDLTPMVFGGAFATGELKVVAPPTLLLDIIPPMLTSLSNLESIHLVNLPHVLFTCIFTHEFISQVMYIGLLDRL